MSDNTTTTKIFELIGQIKDEDLRANFKDVFERNLAAQEKAAERMKESNERLRKAKEEFDNVCR